MKYATPMRKVGLYDPFIPCRSESNSMRLIVDARMINASGIGIYLQNVLRRIITSNKDWTFIVLGKPSELASFPWLNTPQISVHPFLAPIYSLQEQWWWLFNRVKGDVLWVPHYNIPLLYSGKLISTVHDLAHIVLDDYRTSFIKRVYASILFHAVRLRANTIIFVSNFTKKEFTTHIGIPACPTYVIHQGVDTAWRLSAPAQTHLQPYIVYVGNVKPHKNLRRLLAAFESIQSKIPHKLIIIGKKSGFITGDTTVEHDATKLGNRVEFTGHISDDAMRALVTNADLLVMPSYYEGFGLPVIEAMAASCPVLTSSAASLPEVCGDAAAYFDPLNVEDMAGQLLVLLLDNAARNALREKGTQQALRFDWNKTAELTGQAIKDTTSP